MSQLSVNAITNAAGGNTATINGMTPTADSLQGFRNRLINGGMAVGQRGNVVFSSTNNLYGWVDRWLVSISGSTVSALGYQASGYTSGATATTSGYALQIGNLLTTGATTAAVSQRIEALNCSDLNSVSVTFTGKVQQTTGSPQTLTVSINKATAGVNNWSTQSVIGSTTVTIPSGTSAWTPFTFTVALGATDAVNGISANLAYNSLGAQSNSQLYFADCQLEAGSVATPFERRPYGTELALCMRYYWAINTGAWMFRPTDGDPNLKSQLYLAPSVMRTTPTVTVTSSSPVVVEVTNPVGVSFARNGATGVCAINNFQASAEL